MVNDTTSPVLGNLHLPHNRLLTIEFTDGTDFWMIRFPQ
ncbi:MAG: hypothetical protein RL117_1564 [Verrucomicrobiota bacterium]|jgi:hypothetical protein